MFRAASSKSSALMRDSSGGFSEELLGAALGVSSSRAVDHSFVTVEVSRTPLRAAEGRPSLMMEGAWIAEYGFVASRPAYLYITVCWGLVGRAGGVGMLDTDSRVHQDALAQSL